MSPWEAGDNTEPSPVVTAATGQEPLAVDEVSPHIRHKLPVFHIKRDHIMRIHAVLEDQLC